MKKVTLRKYLWPAIAAIWSAVALATGGSSLFHQAPASALQSKSPYPPGDPSVIRAGAALYAARCSSCHGADARGMGNVPSLAQGPVQSASEGEVFWFLGRGSPKDGMPPSGLAGKKRWQLVGYLKSLPGFTSASPVSAPRENDGPFPPPHPPFTDYRFEKPGEYHRISAKDLPAPSPGSSVGNGPEVVPRPAGAWPKVPPGFEVQLYASGLENPRLLRTAPNGDVFLAESGAGKILVFRGITGQGKAERTEEFAASLNRPYGIAFYPPGAHPEWVYVGNTDSVVRFPYRLGEMKASAPAQKLADLPNSPRGHWTRDLQVSLDGKTIFAAVGSASNVDDPDSYPEERLRADILAMNPDGTGIRVFASGIRNAGGGLAVDPSTGALWCSVNERDALGDDLVPDYITRVKEGGFYGWPWWYIGGNQDPRHPGKHPELKNSLVTPDVLLQPHHASLELAFYEGKQFPSEYRGDIFSSQHGSWNRSVRTGYELIRIPLHQSGQASGEYEDFMTGFVVDNSSVWGRPVGVAVANDGSLLVSDDGSNSIWRIVYTGR